MYIVHTQFLQSYGRAEISYFRSAFLLNCFEIYFASSWKIKFYKVAEEQEKNWVKLAKPQINLILCIPKLTLIISR